jgi:hypothetical protein
MVLALVEIGKRVAVQEVPEGAPRGLAYAELPVVQGTLEAHRQHDDKAEQAGLDAIGGIFYQLGLKV